MLLWKQTGGCCKTKLSHVTWRTSWQKENRVPRILGECCSYLRPHGKTTAGHMFKRNWICNYIETLSWCERSTKKESLVNRSVWIDRPWQRVCMKSSLWRKGSLEVWIPIKKYVPKWVVSCVGVGILLEVISRERGCPYTVPSRNHLELLYLDKNVTENMQF